jgi:hypothetical protein
MKPQTLLLFAVIGGAFWFFTKQRKQNAALSPGQKYVLPISYNENISDVDRYFYENYGVLPTNVTPL